MICQVLCRSSCDDGNDDSGDGRGPSQKRRGEMGSVFESLFKRYELPVRADENVKQAAEKKACNTTTSEEHPENCSLPSSSLTHSLQLKR